MNRLFFRPVTGSRRIGVFFTSFFIILLYGATLSHAQQPYAQWPIAPVTPFPYAGASPFWPPSLHIFEAGSNLSPNIGMHWKNSSSILMGVTQWGITTPTVKYSLFATPGDVVLNASEGEDLIFTNLSGSKYSGTNNKGAIRFGTAQANGSGTIPADVERMTILHNGNVGINQTSPTAKLQVTDGAVLFNGTTGGTPVSGAGTRFMWIPGKAALRAGYVAGNEWNDANIGWGSVCLGTENMASGNRAIALGDESIATGWSSIAIGYQSHTTKNASIAIGDNSLADGISSISIGLGSNAIATNAITLGAYNDATGFASLAIGTYGTSEGNKSIVLSNDHAVAEAYGSIVMGTWNILNSNYDRENWVGTDPIFVVGNGASGGTRSNALTILKNGDIGIGNHEPSGTRLLVKSSGNTNATTALDVRNSDDDPLFFVRDDGKIGVGTSAPDALLSVTSTASSPSSAVSLFRIDNATAAEPLLVVREDGFVGIGAVPCSTDADAGVNIKLRVNGTIKAKEIIVETDGWCDFVFEEGYELMPLELLEEKIEELGHLPNIPSAKDVQENGVSVSEMQVKLLQKVEELTLYVIELKKENAELKAEIRGLK